MLITQYQTPLSLLKRLTLLEDLDHQIVEALASHSSIIELTFKKNIPDEFQLRDKIYVVVEGDAFLSCIDRNGKKIIIDNLRIGSIFGDLNLLEEDQHSTNCLFVEPFPKSQAKFCVFNKREFLEILSRYPPLSIRILSNVSKRVSKLEQKIEELAFYSLETRLLIELAKLGQPNPLADDQIKVKPKITHEKLAESTGSVRETVSRALSRLKRIGFVFYDRQKHLVVKLIKRKSRSSTEGPTSFDQHPPGSF